MIEIPRDKDWELETDWLLLLPMFPSDAEALFELLKEPALYSFTGGAPPSSVHGLKERLHSWERRRSPDGEEVWLNWTLRLKGTETVVGYVQASIKERSADLAWVVGLPFQGRGYATEASRKVAGWLTERLKINRLTANIHPKHAASQRVAKHVGLHPGSEVTTEGEEIWIRRF